LSESPISEKLLLYFFPPKSPPQLVKICLSYFWEDFETVDSDRCFIK
jgi:hypothetical protein